MEQPSRGRASSVAPFAVFALLSLCLPGAASAQWATSGSNISNTNTGNVGVGNPSPYFKLTVGNPNQQDGRIAIEGADNATSVLFNTGGANRARVTTLANGLHLQSYSGAWLRNDLFIQDDGNVGIGTTAPAARLDVRGNFILDAGLSPTLFTGTGTAELNRYLNLINSPGLTSASGLKAGGILVSDDYAFANPAKNDLVVKGRIGIGTAGAPAYKLDVAGAVRSTAGGFVFPDGTTQTTAATGTVTAASITPGTFGQNAGVVHFGFPGSVMMNSGIGSFIDTGANNRFKICGPNGNCSLAGEYIGGRIRLSPDGSFANAEAQADPGMGGIRAPGNVLVGGNLGVGTTAPAAKLHVAGDIKVDGNINAKYQDVAEWVPSTQKLAAGTVVVLDPGRPNHVLASNTSYDTAVAGVISARPGLTLGEAGEGKALVATTGRVKVKVDATRAPVKIGDLLVTSDLEGVAMKSEPVVVGGRRMHAPGTIIGKALEPLAGGSGEILVLLSLQ
jgi:hypothetical protein